jgi:hypothetical protein
MFKPIFLFVLILTGSSLIGMEQEVQNDWEDGLTLKVGEKRTIALDVVDYDVVVIRGYGSINKPINGKEKYVTAENVSKQTVYVKIYKYNRIIRLTIDNAGQPIKSMPVGDVHRYDPYLKKGYLTQVTFDFHAEQ